MNMWRGQAFMGKRYKGYYELANRTKYSPLLDKCNFRTALEMVGGESDSVKVIRTAIFSGGCVEVILIDSKDKALVRKGNEIYGQLAMHIPLDPEEYQRRYDAIREEYKQDIIAHPSRWLIDCAIEDGYSSLDAYLDDLMKYI
ncbi:MAG: hypothetical protein WCR85_00365 [Sphaerochaeta sp.]